MRLNEHTGLSTPTLLLVPYSAHHVPIYHTWMQSPELQALTASEPLTLDQEYEMQRSWRQDRDKLTFIVCLPLEGRQGEATEVMQAGGKGVDDGKRMVGDVNLFLAEADESGEDEEAAAGGLVGEIELMIALPEHRRKGYGRAALLAFMAYVLRHWTSIAVEYSSESGSADRFPLAYLRARINESNERSIKLFESVGFKRTTERANYFGEVELRWQGSMEDLTKCKGWERTRQIRYE